MKLLTLFVGLLCSSALLGKALKVSYTSYGAGIDYPSYEAVSGIIEQEKASGNIVASFEESWGLEGEVDLCVVTRDFRSQKRIYRQFSAHSQDPTVFLSEANNCMGFEGVPTACSKMTNDWGNPSECFCEEGQTYNPEYMLCESRYKTGRLKKARDIEKFDVYVLTSFDKPERTLVGFSDKLKEAAAILAERNLPTAVTGDYKVYYQGRRAVRLFVADHIDVLE